MPAPLIRIETRAPLVCLHCAGTQATVLRDRQNADPLLGYANHCVCCDPETGNACPSAAAGIWNMVATMAPAIRKPATWTREIATAAWTSTKPPKPW